MDARFYTAPTRQSKPLTWSLLYGSRIVLRIVPDFFWPGMYRVQWPDGRLSDIANLSWAKDAAEVIAKLGGHDPRLLKWKSCPRERAAASPVSANGKNDPNHRGGS